MIDATHPSILYPLRRKWSIANWLMRGTPKPTDSAPSACMWVSACARTAGKSPSLRRARRRAIAGSSTSHHKPRYPLRLARRNEGIGCWEDSPPATFAGQDEATEGNRRRGVAPSAGDNRDGGLK